jgi:hypothetical protein
MNDRYEVSVWRDYQCVDDGPLCDYLSIKEIEKGAGHDWRHFQMIKNDLCGYERYAFEVYPPESILLDECNQYHVFVMPDGLALPFGFFRPRLVSDDAPDVYAYGRPRQRPFESGTTVPRARRKRVGQRSVEIRDVGRMRMTDD